jgi:hypothetical protein
MPMTRLGRAYVLAGRTHEETSRPEPDWQQIAADGAEFQRIAEVLAAAGLSVRERLHPRPSPRPSAPMKRPTPLPGGTGALINHWIRAAP